MSSYQHQYSMGEFYKEVPDFLTCGFCSKEFLLDNITLFIAHKSGCVDKAQPSSFIEDTSAPLTCSMCSRVFMTARGLLQHIQRDHQMKICLQKGPLLLPDPLVRPPPAHSSVNGNEYTTTDNQKSGSAVRDGQAPCDPCEEPTDLSMTCCNSMGKATVRCSEEECKIIIEPRTRAQQQGGSGTALPKKRKFVFTKNDDSGSDSAASPRCSKLAPAALTDEHRSSSKSDIRKSPDELDTSQASICVTAEYHQQSLKSFSLSTGRKDCEKNVKLKQLLGNNRPEGTHPEQEEQQDEANTKFVYKFPFQGTHKQEPDSDDFQKKTVQEKDTRFDSSDDSDEDVSGNSILRFIPGTTLEQNIDQLIRASISSDSYPEELDIFSLVENTPQNMVDPGSRTRYSPSTQSPQMQNARSKRISQQTTMDIDFSLGNSDKANIGQSFNTKPEDSPSGGLKEEPSFNLPISVPCPVKSRINSTARKHGVYNRKHHSLDVLSSSSPELKPEPQGQPFQKLLGYSGSPHDHATGQQYDAELLRSVDECPGERFPGQIRVTVSRPGNLCSPFTVSSHEPRRREALQWLGRPAEECGQASLAVDTVCQFGVAKQASLTRSNSTDDVTNTSFDQLTVDSEDMQMMDGKMMKKRRYPTSRPFKCTHCDQAFNQRIHLKKHMSKHTGVKPFKCQQCDYSTVERSHLKVHYRIHTELRTLNHDPSREVVAESIDPRSNNSSSNLISATSPPSSNGGRSPSSEKPYRCQFCDYATAQNSTLKIHLKRHHDGTPTSDNTRSRDGFHPPGPRGEEEDSLLSDTFFMGVSADSPPLDGPGLMRTPLTYEKDGLLVDRNRHTLSDHARMTSALVAMESSRRGVLHGKRDGSPGPYSFALKGKDIPNHFISSSKIDAPPHKQTSRLLDLRHSRYETTPRKAAVYMPQMSISDSDMAQLQNKDFHSGSEDEVKPKLLTGDSSTSDRHHVASSRAVAESPREPAGCLKREKDGQEMYSEMFQTRPIKNEVKVDEIYGGDTAAINPARRTPDNLCSSHPNLAKFNATLDHKQQLEQHSSAAINLTQLSSASGSSGPAHFVERRPGASLSPREVSSKSDSRLTAGWENEDDDDSDLEFSVCPPSVNIPNKAFVRG